jgi:hypothetical protein
VKTVLEYRVEQVFYPRSLEAADYSFARRTRGPNGDARYAPDLLLTATDRREEEVTPR